MKKAAVGGGVVAYAWIAAGARPFHTWSYLAVGLPVLVIVAGLIWFGGLTPDPRLAQYYRHRSVGVSWATATPWLAVITAAVVLECIGLALGGRSPDVPTLSTTVDHLLAWRWDRCLLFVAWLLVGGLPVERLRRRRLDGRF